MVNASLPRPYGAARSVALASCLLLASGCAAGGGWTKSGVDAPTAAREAADCRNLAEAAVASDLDIDQDIAASRGSDLQHSDSLRLQTQETHQENQDRGVAIVASCMRAKGFSAAP
jgi:hypothetical protein